MLTDTDIKSIDAWMKMEGPAAMLPQYPAGEMCALAWVENFDDLKPGKIYVTLPQGAHAVLREFRGRSGDVLCFASTDPNDPDDGEFDIETAAVERIGRVVGRLESIPPMEEADDVAA